MGWKTFLLAAAGGSLSLIAVQRLDGSFISLAEPAIAADSTKEAVAAVFFDADGDGDADLYIAYGGYAATRLVARGCRIVFISMMATGILKPRLVRFLCDCLIRVVSE